MTPCLERGFTLIEMLLSIALLGMMMVMIYSALTVGLRAWDSGEARVTEAAHARTVQGFMRREMGQIFPVRWRGIPESKIAFEGEKNELKFVTSLNLDAGLKEGGLQWGHLLLVDNTLQLKREPFDTQAKDWESLADAKPIPLLKDIESLNISYFGAENDTSDPKWVDQWAIPQRLPQLIKITLKSTHGRDLPELIVKPKIGEEAGCYDTNFQRQCGPRR